MRKAGKIPAFSTLVLSQQMVSTPRSEINGDIIQDKGRDESNFGIKLRFESK